MATTERPANVGILAMEWYAPQTYVAQTSLEEQDGCGGKYVVGLGQEAMAFVDDREDIGSRKAPAATTLDAFDHCVFHAPYNKLVQKGFARLALGDDVLAGRVADPPAADWCAAGAAPYEASLADRGLDAALRKASAGAYDAKVAPATLIPKQIGNTYTASVFAGLLSLVADRGDALAGKRVLLFSYGSGSVATMYAFKGREADDAKFALGETRRVADVPARLAARAPCSAAHFARACDVRVERYGKPGYAPTGAAETDGAAPVPLAADAFALAAVDDKHIRSYVAPAN
ncbi:hydroxymethylglutaryl-CoA synthase [Aureococcus anophagefferens]|uniref:Hydroxymethylglutaryl-CoA synthase n=1 Tax=Aureococcus anophagefferens TaxID=44056 RepID=A0ABR1FXZ4_AURAN